MITQIFSGPPFNPFTIARVACKRAPIETPLTRCVACEATEIIAFKGASTRVNVTVRLSAVTTAACAALVQSVKPDRKPGLINDAVPGHEILIAVSQ